MKVDKIMSKHIVTVDMDDTLGEVKEVFDSSQFHHLMVLEFEELQGVISDRDLFKAISPHIGTAAETARDIKTLRKKAHQVMSRDLITLESGSKIEDAVKIFNSHSISCIPIVNDENIPVGIISWRDIFKEMEVQQKFLSAA